VSQIRRWDILVARVVDGQPDVLLAGKLQPGNHVVGAGDIDRVDRVVAEDTGPRGRGEGITRLVLIVRVDDLAWLVDASGVIVSRPIFRLQISFVRETY
jgi:hypothetical protein